MKRFEMLSKIASVIINYNEIDSVIKRDKALEMAETILQVQEKAGMLPPVEKEHWLDRVGLEISNEHLENHGYPITDKRKYYALRGAVVSISTWEPEDEKK